MYKSSTVGLEKNILNVLAEEPASVARLVAHWPSEVRVAGWTTVEEASNFGEVKIPHTRRLPRNT